MGSDPVQAWTFFRPYFRYCLSSAHHCEDHFHSYSYFVGTKMQQSRKTCSQIFAVCFFPIFSVHFHYRWCQLRKWIWEGGSSLHAPNPFTVWKEKALKMLYNDSTTRYFRRCKCGSTPGISWLHPRRSPRLQSRPRSPPLTFVRTLVT